MRQRIASILAVVLTLVSSTATLACSCWDPAPEQLLARSDTVFTGVVQSIETVGSGGLVTTFVVAESFKGAPAGETVRVSHERPASGMCGVEFAPGQTTTLAARRSTRGGYFTSFCDTWMFRPEFIERMRVLRKK